jgi:acyl-coenzyme A synthetase/AMP-(fatty) acid ligase
MVNLINKIFAIADLQPKALAVKGAGVEYDFQYFKKSVIKVAALMRSSGVAPGHVVGLRMHGSLQAIFSLAVMHEGAVAFSAKAPILTKYRNDIDFVFSDEHALVLMAKNGILVNPDLLIKAEGLSAQIQPHEYESENSLVHLVFSSGTTGVPKGVCFTSADLERRTSAANDNWMPSKPFLCELGLDTVSGMQTLFYSLLSGETYLLPSSAEANAKLIYEMQVRSIKTSPAKLRDLLEQFSESKSLAESLIEIQVAGGLLSSQVGTEIANTLGVKLTYLYGSTEVGTVTKGNFSPVDPRRVGDVVSSAVVQIVDDNGVALPFESEGVLRIKTSYQANGYWKLQDSGSSSFRNGWFYPGDRAKVSENGTMHVLGRVDEVVNLAGIKIDPGWIDSQISSYRGLKDFACFAIPDENLLVDKLAIAIVFDSEINFPNLIEYMNSSLGESAPQAVVRVLEIPRNELGKPNRLKLRADFVDALARRNAL